MLREVAKCRTAMWHDDEVWHFLIWISTKSQMARVANGLREAGLLALDDQRYARLADSGRALLSRWDAEHPEGGAG